MNFEGFNLIFPKEYLRASLMVSLISVWMLVGLFYYLNRFTKRDYFNVWTVAWLFYALWLTLNYEMPDTELNTIVFVFKQWCVAISAVFLLWGSLRFLSIPVRQTLFGLFMLFLLVWTFISPQVLTDAVEIQMPVFILLGLGSVFASVCFFRLRRKVPFVGAGMLSLGFLLWGIYLASYPISQEYKDLYSAGIFIGAVVQLFIAISMIMLVLEEVRYHAEQILAEIATVRSEKEALQVKILTTEEESRSFYDQVRLTKGVQEAYEELRRTQQVVVQQERLRALGQMASGMAHDINNALSPILAYSELLLARLPDLPENSRHQLKIINKSADDVARIVARMREFYRRRSDTEQLSMVNLNQIVEEVTDLTRPRWRDVSQKEGVSIHFQRELEPDLPLLLCDPSDLREALTNLIFNAVDALPSGGTITLAIRSINRPALDNKHPVERQIQIEVKDNGVGMDEKTRQRCLEPFFSTKIQRGGTGLGLAMVYGMMQRHEGAIEIDSAPGKGTSIKMNFPIRANVSKSTADASSPKESDRRLQILCVDDDPRIGQLVNDCLSHFNHTVTLASNGKQGLELFRAAKSKNKPYQVVITDLGMPDIDGHQLAKTIKTEFPGTPVIMMTGWGTIMKEDGETTSHVDAVIGKPPRVHELNKLLDELTDPKKRKA